MSGRRILALVPAKGVSRRVPGKNVAELAGVPMFCHSVRVARAVPSISEVMVSSDDAHILSLAEKEGATVHRRDRSLCGDDITNFEVMRAILALLRREGREPELIVLLQPTTPFRTPAPIERMIAAMQGDPDADSLIVVAPAGRLVGRIEENRWLRPPIAGTRMKESAPGYALTGHVFVLRPARTLDRGSLLGSQVRLAPLPADWPDIDVDTPLDLAIAQAVAETFFRGTQRCAG